MMEEPAPTGDLKKEELEEENFIEKEDSEDENLVKKENLEDRRNNQEKEDAENVAETDAEKETDAETEGIGVKETRKPKGRIFDPKSRKPRKLNQRTGRIEEMKPAI